MEAYKLLGSVEFLGNPVRFLFLSFCLSVCLSVCLEVYEKFYTYACLYAFV